jgi:parallel beta-helix repeat protein
MKLRRFAILSSVFACFSTITPAFAATLVVDNDFADCPQADFNSIQAAVVAAQPGDKILVCPGIYAESVLINKIDLRIEAQAAPGEVVLQGTAAQDGFSLTGATGVLLEGFTVQGFRRNIVVQDGGSNTVRKNLTTLAVGGPAGLFGTGILVSNSSGNAVEHNRSFGNANGGITVVAGSGDNAIRNSETFSNVLFGIVVQFAGTGNVVFQNDSYLNGGAGLRINNMLEGAIVIVENNRFFDNNGTGIMVVSNSTPVAVRNNKSARNGNHGIRLNIATSNVVEKNEVDGNAPSGISLENSDGNTVQLNLSRQNGQDGIRVDSLSMGNTIERNVLRQNVEHDAHDDSVGPGTGGTANFWINNKCEADNRGGLLCENLF